MMRILLCCLLAALVGADEGFTQPSAAERRRALGPVRGLSPELVRAFTDTTGFEPVPDPGPSDWLAVHPEPGQPWARYLAARPNRARGERRVIYLQPLGAFDAEQTELLTELRDFTTRYFGLRCELQPAVDLAADAVTARRHPATGQRQLLAGDLLDLLREDLPEDAYCRLGVTMTDLYPEPSWNFVFGMASLRARTGVYSLVRYDNAFYNRHHDADLPPTSAVEFRRRCFKVLAHETGHMFCIEHETYFHGLMNGSNHLGESDAQPLHLGPLSLRKLHHAVGFDVVERYRSLAAFYREHGLEDEAVWVDARLRVIRPEEAEDTAGAKDAAEATDAE